MTRRERAFTFVEVLLALALLTGVAAAIAAWVMTTARAATTIPPKLAWEGAARAALERIHEDVLTFDAGVPAEGERVRCDDAELRVLTREVDFGAVEHRYRLDALEGTLVVETRDLDDVPIGTRTLLDGVTRFEANETDRILSVEIAGTDGLVAKRELRLP